MEKFISRMVWGFTFITMSWLLGACASTRLAREIQGTYKPLTANERVVAEILGSVTTKVHKAAPNSNYLSSFTFFEEAYEALLNEASTQYSGNIDVRDVTITLDKYYERTHEADFTVKGRAISLSGATPLTGQTLGTYKPLTANERSAVNVLGEVTKVHRVAPNSNALPSFTLEEAYEVLLNEAYTRYSGNIDVRNVTITVDKYYKLTHEADFTVKGTVIRVPDLGTKPPKDPGGRGAKTPPETIRSIGTLSRDVLAAFLLENNPGLNRNFVMTIIDRYICEAKAEGVNYEIAFAQMCYHTKYLSFDKTFVQANSNNFFGLTSLNDYRIAHVFNSQQEGIRAHIQHLKGYATKETLKKACVDPRYSVIKELHGLGSSPTINGLSNRWGGADYANNIKSILVKMYKR